MEFYWNLGFEIWDLPAWQSCSSLGSFMTDQDRYLGIFKDEAREHLETLRARLLDLENNPGDPEILKVIMRSAHTIKGSARMVGLSSIGELAHRMEDVLKAVEGGRTPASTETISLLLNSADVIEAAVLGLPDSGPSDEELRARAAEISAFLSASKPAPAEPRSAGPESTLEAELSSLFGAQEQAKPPLSGQDSAQPQAEPRTDRASRATAAEYSPDTMRVKVPKLDNLSNLAGELVIMKSKIENNIHRLERILDQVSETVARSLDAGPERAMKKIGELERFLAEDCNDFLEQFRNDFGFLDIYAEDVLSETLNLRLLPVSTIFDRYHRLVRDLKQVLGKDLVLEISGRDIMLDRQILEEINPALMHLIQNAADHGIEPPEERAAAGKPSKGRIELNAFQRGGNVVIEVMDDGRGIDPAKVRKMALKKGLATEDEIGGLSDRECLFLVFRQGFTTAEKVTGTSGRGVGMSVVWEKVQRLKGSASIDSSPGSHTRIQLVFPPAFYKMKALLVEAGRQIVCLPATFLTSVARLNPADVTREGRTPMVSLQGKIVPMVDLRSVLGLPHREADSSENRSEPIKVVLARIEDDSIAFKVDQIHRLEEVIVKSAGRYFSGAPLFAGVTILRQGDPSIIINMYSLFEKIRERVETSVEIAPAEAQPRAARRVLVVDDSITTRTMEKSILEGAGYEVGTARDGNEALAIAAGAEFDIVITDIEMPGMNGFELTKRLKATGKYSDVPVIVVTSLARDEDKRKGIEAGADAYIVKGAFQQKTLLDAVKRLVGG